MYKRQKQGNVRTGIKDGSSELLLDESMKLDLNQYHTVRYEFQQGLLKVSVDGNLVGEREKMCIRDRFSVFSLSKRMSSR